MTWRENGSLTNYFAWKWKFSNAITIFSYSISEYSRPIMILANNQILASLKRLFLCDCGRIKEVHTSIRWEHLSKRENDNCPFSIILSIATNVKLQSTKSCLWAIKETEVNKTKPHLFLISALSAPCSRMMVAIAAWITVWGYKVKLWLLYQF